MNSINSNVIGPSPVRISFSKTRRCPTFVARGSHRVWLPLFSTGSWPRLYLVDISSVSRRSRLKLIIAPGRGGRSKRTSFSIALPRRATFVRNRSYDCPTNQHGNIASKYIGITKRLMRSLSFNYI